MVLRFSRKNPNRHDYGITPTTFTKWLTWSRGRCLHTGMGSAVQKKPIQPLMSSVVQECDLFHAR